MTTPTTFVYDNAKLRIAGGHMNLAASGDTLKMILMGNGYTPSPSSDTVYSGISANEVSGTGYTAGGVTVSSQAIAKTAANSWGQSWAANTAYNLGQIVIPASANGFVYRCVVAGTSGGGVAPTAGTNASPIVVTATAHGLATGNAITIASVTGNTNMNAASLAVVQSSNTYNLMNPSTLVLVNGNGTFGGSPSIVPTWPTIIGQTITDGTVTWQCAGTSVTKWSCTNPTWSSATITAYYAVLYDSTDSNNLVACWALSPSPTTSTNATFTLTLDANNGGFDIL